MKDDNILSGLVTRAQKGDEEAFAQIYNQCSKSIYFNAVKYLGYEADARDVLQEVMMDLFENIGTIQNPGAIKLYLYRATYHRAINLLKKNRAELYDEETDPELCDMPEQDVEFLPEKFAETRELREHIVRMVDELRPNHRAALLMFYYDGLSVKEIADIMDVTVYSVKIWLQRGRTSLRSKLEATSSKEGVMQAMAVVPVLTKVLQENADILYTSEVSSAVWTSLAAQFGFSAGTAAIATASTVHTAASLTAPVAATTAATAATVTTTGVGIKALAALLTTGIAVTSLWAGSNYLSSRPDPEAPTVDIISDTHIGEDIISPTPPLETEGTISSGEQAAPHMPSSSTEAPASVEQPGQYREPDSTPPPILVSVDTLRYETGAELTAEMILEASGVQTRFPISDITVIGLDLIDTSIPNDYGVLLRLPGGQQCAVLVIIEDIKER